MRPLWIFGLLLFSSFLHAVCIPQTMEDLLHALEINAYLEQKLNERFPILHNLTLSSGTFMTHSARIDPCGSGAVGLTYTSSYASLNGALQPFSHLSVNVNGYFSDESYKSFNVKYALLTPEDSRYNYPGIAFGVDDFLGSKELLNCYVTLTQVIKTWGLELSGGWGSGLYTRGPSLGFFAAAQWFPFWHVPAHHLRNLAFSVELDPICYEKATSVLGNFSPIPLNIGIKYRSTSGFELSCGVLHGDQIALSGLFPFNVEAFQGIFPKSKDPPVFSECFQKPLGLVCPEKEMVEKLKCAFEDQGFFLCGIWRSSCGNNELWLEVVNLRYRHEHIAKMRLNYLLGGLISPQFEKITVIMSSFGLRCQQYIYTPTLLGRYCSRTINPYAFDRATGRREVVPPPGDTIPIYLKRNPLWNIRVSPRFETFFGVGRKKFQYDVGVKANMEGILPYGFFYESQVSYTAFSTLKQISADSCLPGSQLIQVATDYIRYRHENAFSFDMLYLQKAWNMGRGCFSRISLGYFQVNYAGIGAEWLWYPAQYCFACGLEGALVKKRSYSGLGFQEELKKCLGDGIEYLPYSMLGQYFFSFYYDFPRLGFCTKLSVGQFLAKDLGGRIEATRYFENGVRLTGWLSMTNGGDILKGEKYYNRGIALEVPLDFILRCSSRRVWNYGVAAWLRDAGYSTTTGKTLFHILNRERRW